MKLNEAFAAGRTKSSTPLKVGNVSERRCTAVEHLVHQDVNFGPHALRNTQPVKAEKDVSNNTEY